jgi:hypothetical protein
MMALATATPPKVRPNAASIIRSGRGNRSDEMTRLPRPATFS